MTLQALGDWLATLPQTQRHRVRLLEADPVGVVFPHVDQVVGICSQGLLEACQAGLKPAVIGPAFFGGKGFTHDFATPEDYVDALARDRLPSQLALEDYRRFEEFLARALVLHCVENTPAGVIKIAERLAEPNAMPQAEAVLARLPAETPRWPGPWTTLLGELMRNPRPWLYMLRRRRQD